MGSPPRMRGRAGASLARNSPQGITPAYAGKRQHWQRQLRQLRDHPRVCGEEDNEVGESASGVGSPPRMRGRDES